MVESLTHIPNDALRDIELLHFTANVVKAELV